MYSPFPRRRDSKWSTEYQTKSSTVITRFFSYGSFEKRPLLKRDLFWEETSFEKRPHISPSRISFSFPRNISSPIFPGTGCSSSIPWAQWTLTHWLNEHWAQWSSSSSMNYNEPNELQQAQWTLRSNNIDTLTQWTLVFGNFGSRNYLKYDLLRSWIEFNVHWVNVSSVESIWGGYG